MTLSGSRFVRGSGEAVSLLVARLGAAAIFFESGRTKVDGLLSLRPEAIALFRTEYRLPLLDPEFAAATAASLETLLPPLLAIGLLTRPAAALLLGMTLVIQVFVYPDAWPTHLSWAGLLVPLILRGGGEWAADRWLPAPWRPWLA